MYVGSGVVWLEEGREEDEGEGKERYISSRQAAGGEGLGWV